MKLIFFLLTTIITSLLVSCDSQPEKVNTNSITLMSSPITLRAKLDSFYTKDTTQYIFVNATLTNKTLNSFKYIIENCSWAESFTTDSKDLKVYITPCFQNWLFTTNIPPLKSQNYLLTLKAAKPFKASRFRIGFNLITDYKVTNIDSLFSSLVDMKHLIWSNSIDFH